MGKPAKKKFAWSYSTLSAFETCPKQYYHVKVAKDIFEQPSAEASEGIRQHKLLEERIKSRKPLPKDLKHLEPLCTRIEAMPGIIHTEQQIALRDDLTPCGWFDKDVWVRCVLDLSVILGKAARIVDYKTGKRRPDSQQLMLSAGIGFARFPQLKKIKTAFWWLKTKEIDSDVFVRTDVPMIWQSFEPRVARMQEAVESGYFPEKPSGLCKGWCPVKSCQYWEPKEIR